MFNIQINDENKLLITEFKNISLLLLTVIDLILIILSFVYNFNNKIETLFIQYDMIVCALIFIDLMAEFSLSKKSLREFFLKDKNIITLISVIPLNIVLIRYLVLFRLSRFVHVIRLIVIWHMQDNKSVRYFIVNHLLKLLLCVLIIYVVIASVLLVLFDDAFITLGDGFWFTIITATTVGFGDITPTGPIGKSLSLLTIIVGIIFVAIFTAYLTSMYNENLDNELRESLRLYHEGNNENYEQLQDEIKELKENISNLEDKLDNLTEELEKLNNK